MRAILHLDMDCFYAQVEEAANPDLRSRPLGIQQKIIVTCNYEARRRGVGKLQLLSEALRVCPDLVLVDGSDIGRYRRMSNKIHRLVNLLINGAAVADSDPLEPSSPPPVATVERMGLDELFVDVTELVRRHLDSDEATIWPDGTCVFRLPGMLDAARESQRDGSQSNVAASAGFAYSPKDWCGHILGSECDAALDPAHLLLLRTASHVCGEVRAAIYNNFDLTCSGGIARCKLLAKLAAAQNKPNMQTVFLDSPQSLAVFDSTDIRKIPGIGLAVHAALAEHPNLDFDGDLSDEVESTVEDEDVVFTEPFNPPTHDYQSKTNGRESKTVSVPVDVFDLDLAIKERARLLTDKCFMPALRTLLGLAYVSDPGRPFHATLFNIAFVELARSPPQHSISAFFKGQVTKKIFCGGIAETAADHDAPIPALSETLDMEGDTGVQSGLGWQEGAGSADDRLFSCHS
nr:hypothetical protein HK105_007068 [Polyrhizophydium stewartii]